MPAIAGAGSRYVFIITAADGQNVIFPHPLFKMVQEMALCQPTPTLVWKLDIGVGVTVDLGCACHHPDPNVELLKRLGIEPPAGVKGMTQQ